MKETIKINLGQRLYDLNKDAYDRLKKYLDSLKNFFKRSPKEAEEIIQDIEQRIADLFEEKLSEKKQIITSEDIDEIINKMGTVEDFELESEISDQNSESENSEKDIPSYTMLKEERHLFRDIDKSVLGGVCCGMAAYFNIDVVWIRLAFVLLFLLKGAGLIAYIILWFVVPAARTTAQKLQMHGRPVNVENIEQSVKDEFNKVKDNLNRVSKSDSFKKVQSVTAEIFETFGSILLILLKIILVIIGISFAIAGIFFILGLLAIAPFSHIPHLNFDNFPFWEHIVPMTHNFSIIIFALGVVILVPIIGILASSVRFIFNLKKKNSVLSAFSWTIWSLALVFIIVTYISGGKEFSLKGKIEDKFELDMRKKTTLAVKIDEDFFPSVRVTHFNIFGKDILHNNEENKCYVQPNFFIANSEDSTCYLEISKISAFSFIDHRHHFYTHDYKWSLNDTILILNKYFNISEDEIWTIPGMSITLNVPKGKKVIMTGEAKKIFDIKERSNDTVSTTEFNF